MSRILNLTPRKPASYPLATCYEVVVATTNVQETSGAIVDVDLQADNRAAMSQELLVQNHSSAEIQFFLLDNRQNVLTGAPVELGAGSGLWRLPIKTDTTAIRFSVGDLVHVYDVSVATNATILQGRVVKLDVTNSKIDVKAIDGTDTNAGNGLAADIVGGPYYFPELQSTVPAGIMVPAGQSLAIRPHGQFSRIKIVGKNGSNDQAVSIVQRS